MASFNTADYDHLFRLGRRLYLSNDSASLAREIAVELMAMAESVRGQQSSWPNVLKRYRHLTTYRGPKRPAEIIKFERRTRPQREVERQKPGPRA